MKRKTIITSVPNYKTPLKKLQRLRKWVFILNLLKIGIIFTFLSFKKENRVNFCFSDIKKKKIVFQVFITYRRKKCTLIRGMLVKK
jgi:hypothetical protein